LFALLIPFLSAWLPVIIFHLENITDHIIIRVLVVVISVSFSVDTLKNPI